MPVDRLERSRAFYVDTLGLRPDEHWRRRVLGRRDVLRDLGAGELRDGVRAAEDSRTSRSTSTTSPAARAELEAKGVEFPGETLDTGVCHMAFFKDPDGNDLMLHRRYKPYE